MYEGNPVDLRMEKILQTAFLMIQPGSAECANMIRKKIIFTWN